MPKDPIEIIEKYYPRDSQSYSILVVHSEMVQQKTLELASRVPHLSPDVAFVREAAMLHDIGIFMTNAPGIGCTGEHPYMMHGPLGRELLEKEGLPRHALVCERHTGVGLSREDILEQGLPLPQRDMLPVSVEEKLICFADLFYGKNPDRLRESLSIEQVSAKVAGYGARYLQRLGALRALFGE